MPNGVSGHGREPRGPERDHRGESHYRLRFSDSLCE
jgi:hypothetical protein